VKAERTQVEGPPEAPVPAADGAAAETSPAFGPRIRAVRIARGISLRTLARRLGVSPATVSQIETGKTNLSAARLYDILELLGETPRPDATPDSTAVERPHPVAWRAFEPLAWDPVLTAALEVFVAVGYHGATVRDIARRSGLSVPGMYHYYPSKQDMLVAMLERTMRDLLARTAAARDEGGDPVERFARIIECLVLYHTYRREPAFVGASEMRSLQPAARRRIVAERVAQQRMIDVEVEAGVEAGQFLTPNPHDAARAAVTMCTATVQWYRPDGPLRPEQIAERYVGFALHLMHVSPDPVRVTRRAGTSRSTTRR
jgi:AcrR family transcriptional regulator